jgi:Tol biopolymer transport system component
LFRKEGALWIAGHDGRRDRPLATAPGVTGPAMWTREGGSLVYLNFPREPGQLNTLREHFPDEGQDRLIAKTTQYVAFEPNADASVFVAVSGAKATPYILLMLRTTGRELALCEHRSSNPEAAAPVFSPDSRRILFEGDQGGEPAIYSMDVRRLVEATEDN